MPALPVLTAVSDPTWESVLVSAFERRDLGVAVVRRCVDLADLLAAASTGSARAVLLSADLRRLDRDALARLTVAGLAIVGLAPPGDEDAERRLRQLGVTHVLPADAGPELVGATLVAAVGGMRAAEAPGSGADPVGRLGVADPASALADRPLRDDAWKADAAAGSTTRDGEAGGSRRGGHPAQAGPGVALDPGRVVAVWGPTGAPGRTTVALTLATEAAALGVPTLLIDADPYGGSIAQLLGMLEEAPGLAAAARAANNGQLDARALAGFCREVSPGFQVLPGILRAERWPELRPTAVTTVIAQSRQVSRLIVIDCGFCLESDEEIMFDTAAPRRNGATLEALDAADTVLAVGSADPVGLARLVRGLDLLRDVVPDVTPQIVVNRLRRGVVPGDPATEVCAAIERHVGMLPVAVVPLDVAGVDAATGAGLPLRAAAPTSPARRELARLAAALVGVEAASTPRRARRGRRR